MSARRRYVKKAGQYVIAVRLDLATAGFDYHKWGDVQRCKPGDWVVWNDGDTYTVDADVFDRTYRMTHPGRYAKVVAVWATRAEHDGKVKTKEGATHYQRGDYLVSNDADGEDEYAVEAETFESMYDTADSDDS